MVGRPVVGDGGQKVDPGETIEGPGDGDPLRLCKGIGGALPKAQQRAAGGACGGGEQLGAILHQRFVGCAGAIPFEHGEGGVVQRPALAIAEHRDEREDLALAGGQQLLAGELGRGVQIHGSARAIGCGQLRGKGVQVRLVAGRHLEDGGFHLEKALLAEEAAKGRHDAAAHQQERPAVGVNVAVPPGASWHVFPTLPGRTPSCSLENSGKACRKRQLAW